MMNESGCVRNQGNSDSQLKGDHNAAQLGHMYMIIKMSDLFSFVNDLEKIIYGLGFKLILKRNNNDRAPIRVNAGSVANESKIEIIYHGVYLVLILVMIIELLYRKD